MSRSPEKFADALIDHGARPPARLIGALIVSLGVLWACGGSSMKLGPQQGSLERRDDTAATATTGETSSSDATARAPAVASSPGEEDQLFGELEPLAAETSRRAVAAKMPPLNERDRIVGPFAEPAEALTYIDHEGRVSIYLPRYHAAYFARLEPFRWSYGVSLAGYFAFDRDHNLLTLATPPEALLGWPLAYPIAEQIALFAAAYLEERQRLEAGELIERPLAHTDLDALDEQAQLEFWATMEQSVERLKTVNAPRLSQVGGAGCVNRYVEGNYVGCY